MTLSIETIDCSYNIKKNKYFAKKLRQQSLKIKVNVKYNEIGFFF